MGGVWFANSIQTCHKDAIREKRNCHDLARKNYMSKVKALILFLLSCNSSGEMTFLFDLITVEKDNFSGKLMTSCYPDHVDIDSDHTDPQLCSLYAADIYSNLQVAEVCTVDTNYIFNSTRVFDFHWCNTFLYLSWNSRI